MEKLKNFIHATISNSSNSKNLKEFPEFTKNSQSKRNERIGRKYENATEASAHDVNTFCSEIAQRMIKFDPFSRLFLGISFYKCKYLKILVKHLKHAPSFRNPQKRNLSVFNAIFISCIGN